MVMLHWEQDWEQLFLLIFSMFSLLRRSFSRSQFCIIYVLHYGFRACLYFSYCTKVAYNLAEVWNINNRSPSYCFVLDVSISRKFSRDIEMEYILAWKWRMLDINAKEANDGYLRSG